MAISSRTQRLLLSRSGGYCMRCNADLFRLFEDGSVTSVEELAHVIAQSDTGPRSEADLEKSQRDEYDNILVLCPTCHREIDKAHEQFPVEVLMQWKADHVAKLAACFAVPEATGRGELRELIASPLAQNHAAFREYGPHSRHQDAPLTDAVDAWHRAIKTTIIPNNRFVYDVLTKNRALLRADELEVVEQFGLHREGLEYNHLSGDKNASVPLFPAGMRTLLE